jgi:hypothetical protein
LITDVRVDHTVASSAMPIKTKVATTDHPASGVVAREGGIAGSIAYGL